MRFKTVILHKVGQFAPLSKNANRIVIRILWLAVLGIIGLEFINGRSEETTARGHNASEEASNQLHNISQDILTEAANWDWLLISGLIVFVLAISFVDHLKPSFHRCVARLFDRGVLRAGEQDQGAFLATLETESRKWALWFALLIALVMALAWAVAIFNEFLFETLGLGVTLVVLGFIAGGYLGEMASHGRLARAIGTGQVKLHLDPWHVDKAAGIKPVGDYFFLQATFATIPAAFLAVWIWIMLLTDLYDNWYLSYVGLLCVAVIMQALAVFLPLIGFHVEMLEQKRSWQRKLDEEFRQNSEARITFLDGSDVEGQNKYADLACRKAPLAEVHISKRVFVVPCHFRKCTLAR